MDNNTPVNIEEEEEFTLEDNPDVGINPEIENKLEQDNIEDIADINIPFPSDSYLKREVPRDPVKPFGFKVFNKNNLNCTGNCNNGQTVKKTTKPMVAQQPVQQPVPEPTQQAAQIMKKTTKFAEPAQQAAQIMKKTTKPVTQNAFAVVPKPMVAQQPVQQPVPEPAQQAAQTVKKTTKPVTQNAFAVVPKPIVAQQPVQQPAQQAVQPTPSIFVNNDQPVNKPYVVNNLEELPAVIESNSSRCRSKKFIPLLLWDGTFEVINMTSLNKNNKNVLQQHISAVNYDELYYLFPDFSDSEFLRYVISYDNPITVAVLAPSIKNKQTIWKNKVNTDPNFVKTINEFNQQQIMKLADYYDTTEEEIRKNIKTVMDAYFELNKEKIHRMSLPLDKKTKCLKKLPTLENYRRTVYGVDPCYVKYTPIKNLKNAKEFFYTENEYNSIFNKSQPCNKSCNQPVQQPCNQPVQQNVQQNVQEDAQQNVQEDVQQGLSPEDKSMVYQVYKIMQAYQAGRDSVLKENQSDNSDNDEPTIEFVKTKYENINGPDITTVKEEVKEEVKETPKKLFKCKDTCVKDCNKPEENKMSRKDCINTVPAKEGYRRVMVTQTPCDVKYVESKKMSRKDCINTLPAKEGYRRVMVKQNPCEVKYVETKKKNIENNIIGTVVSNPLICDDDCKYKFDVIKNFLDATGTHIVKNNKKSRQSKKN